MNRKVPVSLVTVLRLPINAAPLSVTVTPGSTAFDASATLPSIAPVVELTVCASAPFAKTNMSTTNRAAERGICSPFFGECISDRGLGRRRHRSKAIVMTEENQLPAGSSAGRVSRSGLVALQIGAGAQQLGANPLGVL